MSLTEVLHLLNGDLPSKDKHTCLPAVSPPAAALLPHFKGDHLHLGFQEVVVASSGMYFPVATKLGMKVKGRTRVRGRKGNGGEKGGTCRDLRYGIDFFQVILNL